MNEIKIHKYRELQNDFLENFSGILFHSKEWIEVLIQTYDVEFIIAQDSETKDFLIFGVIENPFDKKLVSMPFSDYAGEDEIFNHKISEIIAAVQKEYPFHDIFYKSRFSQKDSFVKAEVNKSAYYHRIEIKDKNIDTLLEFQSSSFKRGVRKAFKEGLKTEKVFSKKDIIEFYKLYADLRLEKFNIIPQPFSFFENIHEVFLEKNKGFILKACYNNRTIGAIIVLEHKAGWYYKFGASHRNYLDKRPNNLLFHELIKLAVKEKKSFIDLGMSGSSPNYEGLRRFKEAMGGENIH